MDEIRTALTAIGVPAGVAVAVAIFIMYGPKLLVALRWRVGTRNEDSHAAAQLRESDELRMRGNMEKDIDRLREDVAAVRADLTLCEARHDDCQLRLETMAVKIRSLEIDRDQYIADRDRDANIR